MQRCNDCKDPNMISTQWPLIKMMIIPSNACVWARKASNEFPISQTTPICLPEASPPDLPHSVKFVVLAPAPKMYPHHGNFALYYSNTSPTPSRQLTNPPSMAAVQSVQCFGKKKTATAVAHCKQGKGLIKVNGRPLSLVEPQTLRFKVYEPILILGMDKFGTFYASISMVEEKSWNGNRKKSYKLKW